MNTLSLVIYFAGMVGPLKIALGVILGGTLLALFDSVIACSDPPNEKKYRYTKFWAIPVVLALLIAIIPTEKTIYLIAGSEVGQMVLESPEAKEIYQDIRGVIKSYHKE